MANARKSVLVLGRQPELGRAELESLYGKYNLQRLGDSAAALDLDPTEIDFERLGGSIKLARLLNTLPHDWPNIEQYLLEQIPAHMKHVPDGKFTLGLSVYGIPGISSQTINKTLMKIKKGIREASGRAVRMVPNSTPALNSAQVIHNKLAGLNGWELLLIRGDDKTILAQTVKVQDIAAYGRRDQARPKRDATVGMLPPKLAQIIINLINPAAGTIIVDPFCGTGVILQEALLMGYDAVGTDLDERMVEYSKANIDWLRAIRPQINNRVLIEAGDATNYTWPAPIGAVASETYLGRPLAKLPQKSELEKISNNVNTILTKFLKNLSPQLKPGTKICLAVPAWRSGNSFIHLPLIDHLTDMGYNRLDFQHVSDPDLVYYRPGQIVGRRLLVLQKI